MSTEADLKTALDAIQTDVTNVSTQFASFKQTIADLQAQVAAGSPVTQAQLDDLVSEATAIDTTLKTVGQ